jgi:lipopolysaccharide transport system ATP-binding protein
MIEKMSMVDSNVVVFDRVSKKYNLGMTRTSVMRSFANSINAIFKPASRNVFTNQILWALRDANFELKQGESLALIGKNGAGKSTMLKLLAGITRPTSGDIHVNGRVSALIELGSGFHGDLTGRENVFLNGAVLGMKRREIKERYDEIVAFSEIEDFIDTPVKRYSSGMLVRLGFAVAACVEPEILLVDEVLAVGDAAFREKCLIRIKKLLDKGTSLIFVSHNINMIEAICSTALYIKSGQIVDRGDVKSVISSYERDLHEERARKFDENSGSQPNSAMLGDVKIENINIMGKNTSPDGHLLGNEPVEIEVVYTAGHSLDKAEAVFRIVRSDGLTCCMVRTAVDGYHLSLRQGQGRFSVRLDPLQLIGGKYFVDAFLSTARDLVLLDNKRSDWFFVQGESLSFEEQSGVFEPFRKWSHDATE